MGVCTEEDQGDNGARGRCTGVYGRGRDGTHRRGPGQRAITVHGDGARCREGGRGNTGRCRKGTGAESDNGARCAVSGRAESDNGARGRCTGVGTGQGQRDGDGARV